MAFFDFEKKPPEVFMYAYLFALQKDSRYLIGFVNPETSHTYDLKLDPPLTKVKSNVLKTSETQFHFLEMAEQFMSGLPRARDHDLEEGPPTTAFSRKSTRY